MRVKSDYLDNIIGEQFPILDKGFIRVIDYMGDDSSIVQMARVSYGEGTKSVNEDRGLIRYLMSHKHTSPFEGCSIKFHVKMPIFVARQWIRHRTAKVNEYSARYSIVRDEFYIPEPHSINGQSSVNKQGSDGELDDVVKHDFITDLESLCNESYHCYEKSISNGISRETARILLPINAYTEMYWKIDLHNLLHFLRLRDDKHAQPEIMAFASKMAEIVKGWCPNTYEAFEDYAKNSYNLSSMGVSAMIHLLKNVDVDIEILKNFGMNKRESEEFLKVFHKN